MQHNRDGSASHSDKSVEFTFVGPRGHVCYIWNNNVYAALKGKGERVDGESVKLPSALYYVQSFNENRRPATFSGSAVYTGHQRSDRFYELPLRLPRTLMTSECVETGQLRVSGTPASYNLISVEDVLLMRECTEHEQAVLPGTTPFYMRTHVTMPQWASAASVFVGAPLDPLQEFDKSAPHRRLEQLVKYLLSVHRDTKYIYDVGTRPGDSSADWPDSTRITGGGDCEDYTLSTIAAFRSCRTGLSLVIGDVTCMYQHHRSTPIVHSCAVIYGADYPIIIDPLCKPDPFCFWPHGDRKHPYTRFVSANWGLQRPDGSNYIVASRYGKGSATPNAPFVKDVVVSKRAAEHIAGLAHEMSFPVPPLPAATGILQRRPEMTPLHALETVIKKRR